MDPLHPAFRDLLKQAHPDLTDAIIDRYEELTARQFLLDPEADAERFAALDRERQRILREYMPRYRELWQEFEERRRSR